MHWMKRPAVWLGIGTLGLTGLPLLGGSPAVEAHPIRRISVNPPVSGGPGGRSPGGSRSDDCLGQDQIKSLNSAATAKVTSAQSPTFSFQVPSTSAKAAVFVLQADRKQVYRSTVKLNQAPGIVNVHLPATAMAGLEVGKNYRWMFSLVCSADNPSKNPYIQGQLKRL